MKHTLSLSMLATLVAGASTLYAQPPSGESPVEVAPSPPPPPPQVTAPMMAPEPPPENVEDGVVSGVAVEVRIDTAQVLVEDDFALPALSAGIFLGHRGRSLTVGVGFDFSRLSQSQSASGMESSASSTTFLVIPGARFVLARTGDAKTELLGQVDAGYGLSFRRGGGVGSDPPSIHRLRVQAGPSLRHWITPSFAVGATAGLRYDRSSVESDQGLGMTSEQAIGVTALFSSVHMTAVF